MLNSFVNQHNVLQIPPEVLHLCVKYPQNLNFFFPSYPWYKNTSTKQ